MSGIVKSIAEHNLEVMSHGYEVTATLIYWKQLGHLGQHNIITIYIRPNLNLSTPSSIKKA